MRILKILLSVSLLLTPFLNVFAQIEVGTWREHFSYKNSLTLTDGKDKIYVAGELGIFSYDKEEGLIETITKSKGLSDSEIQTIAYNKFNNTLVIAYKNSNIDIIKDNTIYNISEIKRKQISNDKTINKISFYDDIAYLSCGFGIVVLNTNKVEISDTYFIGENSSYININDVAIFNNKIYAATDEGLFYANTENTNLADYRNWQVDSSVPNSSLKFILLNNFNNSLYAAYEDELYNSSIYKLNNENWTTFKTDLYKLKSITSSDDNIVITTRGNAYVYDKYLDLIKEIGNYSFPDKKSYVYSNKTSSVFDNNTFYISDASSGLVFGTKSNLNHTYPNGPISNETAHCEIFENKLITTNGNDRATAWYNPEYNVFENEEWQTYGVSKDTARNFYSIAINPNNPDNIFIGAFGYGIFEFKNNEFTESFNQTNSTLQAIPGYDYGYLRITALAFDKNNNLWATNHYVPEPISVKTEKNEWQSFNFNGLITEDAPTDILVTQDNNKWFLLGEGRGMLVLNDNNTPLDKTDDTFRRFSPIESNGNLISSTVTAITQDKNENVWIGTDDGVAIYYNPSSVFESGFYADKVQLTSYGNDTTEQYLFATNEVTDIEVDGANRKWIATKSAGIFLMSENGKEEILSFNIYNSPLPSNTINDIAINHISGEVFILTDKGIVSYRSDATKADETFSNVYVFPNPIRSNYSGKITVTGLADEVNVKFTDISGNVVYETTALGGQAIWDGKTFDGRKVNSGVYLIFCTNEDGTQTQVAKLLFMN
ncbi:MAG: T9SS type A sorting domain-containing protein [Chlorobi bacterium]|nr:T9SS type A sorting domain-containing protein [Chlorobiota bacterium]